MTQHVFDHGTTLGTSSSPPAWHHRGTTVKSSPLHAKRADTEALAAVADIVADAMAEAMARFC